MENQHEIPVKKKYPMIFKAIDNSVFKSELDVPKKEVLEVIRKYVDMDREMSAVEVDLDRHISKASASVRNILKEHVIPYRTVRREIQQLTLRNKEEAKLKKQERELKKRQKESLALQQQQQEEQEEQEPGNDMLHEERLERKERSRKRRSRQRSSSVDMDIDLDRFEDEYEVDEVNEDVDHGINADNIDNIDNINEDDKKESKKQRQVKRHKKDSSSSSSSCNAEEKSTEGEVNPSLVELISQAVQNRTFQVMVGKSPARIQALTMKDGMVHMVLLPEGNSLSPSPLSPHPLLSSLSPQSSPRLPLSASASLSESASSSASPSVSGLASASPLGRRASSGSLNRKKKGSFAQTHTFGILSQPLPSTSANNAVMSPLLSPVLLQAPETPKSSGSPQSKSYALSTSQPGKIEAAAAAKTTTTSTTSTRSDSVSHVSHEEELPLTQPYEFKANLDAVPDTDRMPGLSPSPERSSTDRFDKPGKFSKSPKASRPSALRAALPSTPLSSTSSSSSSLSSPSVVLSSSLTSKTKTKPRMDRREKGNHFQNGNGNGDDDGDGDDVDVDSSGSSSDDDDHIDNGNDDRDEDGNDEGYGDDDDDDDVGKVEKAGVCKTGRNKSNKSSKNNGIDEIGPSQDSNSEHAVGRNDRDDRDDRNDTENGQDDLLTPFPVRVKMETADLY